MNKETLDYALILDERIKELTEHKRHIVISSNKPYVTPKYYIFLGANNV